MNGAPHWNGRGLLFDCEGVKRSEPDAQAAPDSTAPYAAHANSLSHRALYGLTGKAMNDENPYRPPMFQSTEDGEDDDKKITVWRDGPFLVLPKHETELPNRCVVCNDTTDAPRMRFKLRPSASPASFVASFLLGGPLNCLLGSTIGLLLSPEVSLKLTLCWNHRVQERNIRLVFRVLLLFGILTVISGVVVAGVLTAMDVNSEWILDIALAAFGAGCTLIITAVVQKSYCAKLIRMVHTDGYYVWLDHVHIGFLRSFPDVLDPRNAAKAHYNRSVEYFKQGQIDDAIAHCSEAIRLNPAAAAYRHRARLHGNKGEYDRAITDCTEAIRLDSANVDVYLIRAEAYFSRCEYDKALADFSEALRLAPRDIRADSGRVRASREIGERNKVGEGGASQT